MENYSLHSGIDKLEQSYHQSNIRLKVQCLSVITMILFLAAISAMAQGPKRKSDLHITGMSNGQSEIVTQAKNGDLVIGKYIFFNKFQLIRVSNNGTVKLNSTMTGSDYIFTSAILNTADDGYLLGSKISNAEGQYYQILKLNSSGKLLWKKQYGVPDAGFTNYHPVIQTTDGGFVIGSYTGFGIGGDKSEELKDLCPDYYTNPGNCSYNSDFWIIKVDQNGNKLWDKSFGGGAEDNLRVMIPTADGGCLLAGNSFSITSANKTSAYLGIDDIWLVKVASNGAKQWEKSLGGDDQETPTEVVQLSDESFLIRAESYSSTNDEKKVTNNGDPNWMVKVSKNGEYLWDKFPTWAPLSDAEEIIISTKDQGFLVGVSTTAGSGAVKSETSRGGLDYWMVKYNNKGIRQWDKRFGGSADDKLRSLLQLSDASFQLFGYSLSGASGDKTVASTKGWLVKTYPAAPLDLKATPVSTNQIDLLWNDNLVNEDFYYVQRAVVTGNVIGSFTNIATLGGAAVSYSDKALQTNTTYAYRVRASKFGIWQGPSGTSDYSDTAIATVTDAPVRITSFSPVLGPVGTEITIKGYGFIEEGAYYVSDLKINNTAAALYGVESETEIKVKVAAGTSSGKISLIAQDGTLVESEIDFTVTVNLVGDKVINSEATNGKDQAALIYPNPVQKTLTIELPAVKQKEVAATLYDHTGTLYKTFDKMESGEANQLDVSDIPAGVYYLTIPTDKNKCRFRLVKE